ncbi:MAG: hypothetical protein WD207_04360 [Xanthobacteraceae bacterium]
MNASVICLRAAILILIAGLAIGLRMGMTDDHSLMPAHAHTNLAGFVILSLYGLTYHAFPAMGAHKLARIQAWGAIVGAVVMSTGLVFLYGTGDQSYEPVVVIGSLIFFAGTLLFAWILFSGTRGSVAA